MAKDEIEFTEVKQSSELNAKLESTGFWKVSQNLVQSRRVDNESEWESKTVTMSASAKTLDVALAEVFLSMEGYLVARNHDLFSELDEEPIIGIGGELLN